jgi:PKD repeat protein
MRLRASSCLIFFLIVIGFSKKLKAQVSYDSSYVVQVTDSLFAGQKEAKMLQLIVVLSGSSADSLKLKDISFSPKGTGNRNDILKASLFYLDSNAVINQALKTEQKVADLAFPKATANTFGDSIYLKPGTHHFILTYDLDYSISVNDSFDAELLSFDVGENLEIPTVTAPSGNRKVSRLGSSVYCKNTRSFSGSYEIGPTKVVIGNLLEKHSENSDFYYEYGELLDIRQGQKIPIEIETGPYYNETQHVWIDWDGDGFFEANEKVLNTNAVVAGNSSKFTVTAPCGENAAGIKRMRVIGEFYSSTLANSCSAVSYGSVEEYVFQLLPENEPKASFVIDTTAFSGGVVFLKNSTENTGNNINYEWDLNDDKVFDTAGVDMLFKANLASQQTVVLKAEMISCDNKRRYFSTFKGTVKLKSISKAPVAEFIANTNYVAPNSTVAFRDLTENGVNSWKWTVVPSRKNGVDLIQYVNGTNQNSPNPQIRFKELGKYAVLLEVGNSKGKDKIAKLGYITVQDDYVLCRSKTFGDTITNSFGIITDNGGRDNKYSNNANCGVLIKPICAEEVHLDLSRIDISKWVEIGNSGDYLRVYDGTSNSDSALHTQLGFRNGIFTTGVEPASLGRLTAKSGSMFLQFTSDESISADGFEVQYSITPKKVAKPNARIIGIDTTYINTPEYFTAGNNANWIEKVWDFDGDGLPESFGNEVVRRFPSFGTYNVSVVLNACGTTDTATKSVVVLAPGQAPIANFETTFKTVSPSDTIRLMDVSDFGPTEFRWRVDRKSAVQFVNGTSARTRNPYLVFDSLGFYTIGLWVKNGMGEDSTYKTQYIFVRDYCLPSVVSDAGKLGITKVVISSLKGDTLVYNQSSRKAGFSNFSSRKRMYASPGERFVIRVERKDTSYAMQRMMWIDFDLDGNFESSELALYEGTGRKKVWTDTFTIDTASAYGLSRIRVAANTAGRTNYGCGPHLSGEFEDYGIYIIPDNTPPLIELKGPETIGIEMCGSFSEPGYTAFDNVDGDITLNVDTTGAIGFRFPGLYGIKYSVKDVAGNMAEVYRIIAVGLDSTAPEISLKGNLVDTIEVYSTYNDLGFIADDFCAGLDSTNTSSNLDTSKLGAYFITYSAYDYVGNFDSISRKVVVVDTTAPSFSLRESTDTVFVEVGTEYIDSGFIVSDNYDTTFYLSTYGAVYTEKLDTFLMEYQVFDRSMNGSEIRSRTVIVVDRTAPLVELPFDSIEIEVGRRVNLPEPWVYDNYDRTPQLSIIGSFDKDIVGEYEIEYAAKDKSGNLSDTAVLTVSVIDNVAPSIVLNAAPFITHCRWRTFLDSGVSISDNYYELDEIEVEIRYVNTLDEEVTIKQIEQSNGYYTAIYTAIDDSENQAQAYRSILVEECNPNAIKNQSYIGFSIYPNPAHSTTPVYVSSEISDIKSIEIYTIDGKFIKQIEDPNSVQKISGLNGGVYTIKVLFSNAVQIQTLVVIN